MGSFYGTDPHQYNSSRRLPRCSMRLLFSSIHCCLDPSSGAALCTWQLLELLAARGAECRVHTTGILDAEREMSLDEVLATLELPVRRFQAVLGTGGAAEVIDLSVNGVRVTLIPTVSSRAERSPDPRESAIYLELAEQAFDRFRPDVLLTHGGHPATPWPHPGRAGPGRASGYPGSRIPQRPLRRFERVPGADVRSSFYDRASPPRARKPAARSGSRCDTSGSPKHQPDALARSS